MTQEHPITPPPELVEQWRYAASNVPASLATDPGGRRDYIDYIATQAARWGADQELEACCEWFQEFYETESWVKHDLKHFRAARRPKPPSHKELALIALTALEACAAQSSDTTESVFYIRRALESLPN